MDLMHTKEDKWMHQRVSKKFKNKSCGAVRPYRRLHGRSPNAVDHKSACFAATYSVHRNIIPVWQCAQCTYINVERTPLCHICAAEYSHVHTQHTTAANSSRSRHSPNHRDLTLNDFFPSDLQETEHRTFNSYFFGEDCTDLKYDEDIQWIDFAETPSKPHSVQQQTDKARLITSIENGEFGVISESLKHKIVKSHALQKCLPKLKCIQNRILTRWRNEIAVKCLLTDHWLNILQKEDISFSQFVYTSQLIPWKMSQKNSRFQYVSKMRQVRNDPVIKLSGMDTLFQGICRREQIAMPLDVFEVCLLYIGLLDALLPYAMNGRYNNDIYNYYWQRNEFVECSGLLIDACHALRRTDLSDEEIFICATTRTQHEIGCAANGHKIQYCDLIPILSVTRKSDYKHQPLKPRKRRRPTFYRDHGVPQIIRYSMKEWKEQILQRKRFIDVTRNARRTWKGFGYMT